MTSIAAREDGPYALNEGPFHFTVFEDPSFSGFPRSRRCFNPRREKVCLVYYTYAGEERGETFASNRNRKLFQLGWTECCRNFIQR